MTSRPIPLAFLALLSWLAAGPAAACGPEALGTARVLAVGTVGGGAVGLKTYPRTLLLEPGEVVLTFDDGPSPGRTDRVLDALKAQCVRATFFMVGRDSAAAPALAARVAREGHSIGYHTMDHANLRHLRPEAAEADIERGFQAVDLAAYGVARANPQTPFFRFPGFADTPLLDRWLAERDIVVFGADLWASDWLPETSGDELKLILARLDRSKGGILLFHDIQPRTVAMLPTFLEALRARGFRVVHIEAGPGALATRPAPPGWSSETERFLRRSGGAGG